MAVPEWVRRGCGSSHRVVHAGGSRPDEDSYQFVFRDDFYFSFVRPNVLQ